MAPTFRGCTAGMVMAAGLLRTVPAAAADPTQPLTLVIVVTNQAEVPQSLLNYAEAEAARIYRSVGVNLVWAAKLETTAHPRRIINIVSKPIGRGIDDCRALGTAAGTKEQRGLAAWVFYGRIVDFGTILRLDPGLLLGHVIAHEIGHLLLPYDSHSLAGLMRAGWDKLQAAGAATGTLTFSPPESALIRRSLARMAANR